MVKIMEARLLHKYICTLFQTQTCNSSLGPGCTTALPYKTPPHPHTHTHICWVQFTKNLIAKQRHICKPFQMLLLSWTRSCRRTGHCIHCATPPPRSGHLKEIQGSRVEDGMWVYVRGEQQETHPLFSCSGGLYCPGSVLKPSSSLPYLNSFKIFFFTDTPQAPYPHPNAKQ